jgi:hypothetical protein
MANRFDICKTEYQSQKICNVGGVLKVPESKTQAMARATSEKIANGGVSDGSAGVRLIIANFEHAAQWIGALNASSGRKRTHGLSLTGILTRMYRAIVHCRSEFAN